MSCYKELKTLSRQSVSPRVDEAQSAPPSELLLAEGA